MKHEYLMQMDADGLEAYAACMGIDISNLKTKKAKVEKIEQARKKEATINVLGLNITIPIARVHDKRIVTRAQTITYDTPEDELNALLRDIVGDDNFAAISERCKEDDGYFDIDAYSSAMATILYSEKLKNF